MTLGFFIKLCLSFAAGQLCVRACESFLGRLLLGALLYACAICCVALYRVTKLSRETRLLLLDHLNEIGASIVHLVNIVQNILYLVASILFITASMLMH
jgi:hypothetical protein